MVTAVSSTARQPARPPPLNTKRTQLFPSDSNNAPPPRRPKDREVASRYLSPSSSSNSSSSTNTTFSSSTSSGSSISSRRSPSPMLANRAAVTTPKTLQRAVSAERSRPAVSAPSSAEKLLVRSIRNLSVSFQGESYAVPMRTAKPPPVSAAVTPTGQRKSTPERRKALATPATDRREKNRENSRPSDQQQHRWPGRLRADNSSFLTRSLDYGGGERGKLSGSGSVLRDLRKSMVDESSMIKVFRDSNPNNDNEGTQGIIKQKSRQSLRDSLNSDPASPNRASGSSKLTPAKPSSPRGLCPPPRALSPARVGGRAASPCKSLTSSTGALLRGIASPSRARSTLTGVSVNESNNACSTPSMLSFGVDVRRGRVGENKFASAHDLKLLYNRLLQWRLANAKVDYTMLVQRRTTEESFYNAWLTTSELRHSVTSKGIELQLLKHNLKLYSILKKEEPQFEKWGQLERDHCISVSGAIKALESSTVRLPVVCGAKADVHKVQEAITSAVDAMQAMGSSVCSLLMKVEQMNSLVSELSKLSAREHRLLDECKDTFSQTLIPLQVIECSLRTQILQVSKGSTVKRV